MELDRQQKEAFLALLHDVVQDQPEFVTDIYSAIQQGIRHRLEYEQEQRSQLAAGFGWLWEKTPEKKLESNRQYLSGGAEALAKWYEGSTFGKRVAAWVAKEGA